MTDWSLCLVAICGRVTFCPYFVIWLLRAQNTRQEDSDYACKIWACQELSACRKCVLRKARLYLYKQMWGFVWCVRIKQVSCKQVVGNESEQEADVMQPRTWGLLLELQENSLSLCLYWCCRPERAMLFFCAVSIYYSVWYCVLFPYQC